MREVKVRKEELIEKVRANRDRHRSQYEKAIEGWAREALQVMEADVQALKAHTRRYLTPIDQPPQDHTIDYDRVIPMITMSVDDTITLDAATFRQYVLDDWNWKDSWAATTAKYLGK